MTTKVFTTYNLKPETDIDEFLDFSRNIDQPTCAKMAACESFEVYIVRGEVSGKPVFQIIENIDVVSWEAWQETLASEEFAEVARLWPRYADESSLVSVYTERI